MTLEQTLEEIKEKSEQVYQLRREIDDLKGNLKNLTPFKVGDKVLVKVSDLKEQEAFIRDVEYVGYEVEKYKYTFNDVKQDGTMSGRGAGIYSYEKVILIAKAEEI